MAGVSNLTVEIYDPDGKTVTWQNRSEAEIATEKLVGLLGAERIIQLASLILEVCQKTGYGDVKIVVAEGRVTTLKQEISYK